MRCACLQGDGAPCALRDAHKAQWLDSAGAEEVSITRALHLRVLVLLRGGDLKAGYLEDVAIGGAGCGVREGLDQEVGQRAVVDRADLLLVGALRVAATGDKHVALAQRQPAAWPQIASSLADPGNLVFRNRRGRQLVSWSIIGGRRARPVPKEVAGDGT